MHNDLSMYSMHILVMWSRYVFERSRVDLRETVVQVVVVGVVPGKQLVPGNSLVGQVELSQLNERFANELGLFRFRTTPSNHHLPLQKENWIDRNVLQHSMIIPSTITSCSSTRSIEQQYCNYLQSKSTRGLILFRKEAKKVPISATIKPTDTASHCKLLNWKPVPA